MLGPLMNVVHQSLSDATWTKHQRRAAVWASLLGENWINPRWEDLLHAIYIIRDKSLPLSDYLGTINMFRRLHNLPSIHDSFPVLSMVVRSDKRSHHARASHSPSVSFPFRPVLAWALLHCKHKFTIEERLLLLLGMCFALRTTSISRLTWEDVSLDERGHLYVNDEKSKTDKVWRGTLHLWHAHHLAYGPNILVRELLDTHPAPSDLVFPRFSIATRVKDLMNKALHIIRNG